MRLMCEKGYGGGFRICFFDVLVDSGDSLVGDKFVAVS